MTATSLTMDDLLNLYQPGQLGDLTTLIQSCLPKLTSAIFSTIPQNEIRSLGSEIMTMRTNTLAQSVINTSGAKSSDIRRLVEKYNTIPPNISGYVQPPVSTNTEQLAKDNPLFGPIIMYVDTALGDFGNTILFDVIQDNIATKLATRIEAIVRLLRSYLAFLSSVPSRLSFPGSILDANFSEISSRLSANLSKTLGTVFVPPGSVTFQNIGFLCGGAGTHPDATLRKTSGTVLMEVAVSIRLSLAAIVTANRVGQFNTPANIASLRTIPTLLQNFVTASIDPFCLRYLPNMSGTIVPIAQATQTLFSTLNSSNFSAHLSQANTGIMNYIITQLLNHIPHSLSIYMGWLGTRMIGRSFQSMDQIFELTAKIVVVLKEYTNILNVIINVFRVRIQDDPAGLRVALNFNNITLKNGFSVLLTPVIRGGKLYKHKRSRKHRRRRRIVRSSKRHSRRS